MRTSHFQTWRIKCGRVAYLLASRQLKKYFPAIEWHELRESRDIIIGFHDIERDEIAGKCEMVQFKTKAWVIMIMTYARRIDYAWAVACNIDDEHA